MDSPRRPPLAHVPAPVRIAMAVGGLVVGLVLVYAGARSCEQALEEPSPSTITLPAEASAN